MEPASARGEGRRTAHLERASDNTIGRTLKNHLGLRPPVGVETVEVYPLGGRERPTAFWWAGDPAKKHGPWVVAHVRVVTPSGDPV